MVSFKTDVSQAYVTIGLMTPHYNFNFDFLETSLLLKKSSSTHLYIISCSKCLNTDQRNGINCAAAATADVISTDRGQPSVEIC